MKIRLASIFVDDQDKALRFYTNVLGFIKKQDFLLGDFRWLTVVSPEETEGTELVLEPSENPAVGIFKKALFEQRIPSIAFEVNNIQKEYERLNKLGVRFTDEPVESTSTLQAVFDDTCGNFIQLYQI